MLAVDTNVLVRILIDDPASVRQCEAARRLAAEAESVYVAQVVQVETVWVLDSVYRFGRAKLADALMGLTTNRGFDLQRPEVFREALRKFRTGTVNFADYIILAEAHAIDTELATFDKKLSKQTGVRLVA